MSSPTASTITCTRVICIASEYTLMYYFRFRKSIERPVSLTLLFIHDVQTCERVYLSINMLWRPLYVYVYRPEDVYITLDGKLDAAL